MAISLGLHVIEEHTPPSPLSSTSTSSADIGRGSSYGHSSGRVDSSVRGHSSGGGREGGGGGGEGRGESGSGGFTCPEPELSILLKPILSIRQYITSLVDYVSSGKRHYILLVTHMHTYIYTVYSVFY